MISYDQSYTIDQRTDMPVQKNNLSTTASTRLLAALPSKVYLAMYSICGGNLEARVEINNLARALVLNYFVNSMEGRRFLTDQEIELLDPLMQVHNFSELSPEDWDELETEFKNRGNGDPSSPAYIVSSLADLEPQAIAPSA